MLRENLQDKETAASEKLWAWQENLQDTEGSDHLKTTEKFNQPGSISLGGEITPGPTVTANLLKEDTTGDFSEPWEGNIEITYNFAPIQKISNQWGQQRH